MDIRRERIVYTNGERAWIRCLTRQISAPEDRTKFGDIHYHEHIELLYGLEGVAKVLVGDRVYTMEPGDLIIINSKANKLILSVDIIRLVVGIIGYVFQFIRAYRFNTVFGFFINLNLKVIPAVAPANAKQITIAKIYKRA